MEERFVWGLMGAIYVDDKALGVVISSEEAERLPKQKIEYLAILARCPMEVFSRQFETALEEAKTFTEEVVFFSE